MTGTPENFPRINPMPQSPGDGAEDRDIFYNLYFGDYWIVKNEKFVLINDGWSVPLSDPVGFVKIGHIEDGDFC